MCDFVIGKEIYIVSLGGKGHGSGYFKYKISKCVTLNTYDSSKSVNTYGIHLQLVNNPRVTKYVQVDIDTEKQKIVYWYLLPAQERNWGVEEYPLNKIKVLKVIINNKLKTAKAAKKELNSLKRKYPEYFI